MRKKYISVHAGKIPAEDNWDGIRLGSETCPLLLPDKALMEKTTRDYVPEKLSLVTPLTGQKDLARVLSAAEVALDLGFSEIVVNDWGVLHELSGISDRKLTAGRLLLRFRRGPGQSDSWDHLDAESRKYFSWGPLYDRSFLSFLSTLNVARLELDPPRHWMAIPVPVNLALSFHSQYRLVSVSAFCPWRYSDETEGGVDMDVQCDKCLKSGPVRLDAAPLEKPLLQWGHSILEAAADDWAEEDLPPEVDRIIYEGEPLSGMVSAMKT